MAARPRSATADGAMAANRFRSAAGYLPDSRRLADLRRAAERCEGCDLYREATQTVFGAGSTRARLLLVGEQPGDVEDSEGEPFVGPAGRMLDRALDEAAIERRGVYVTNAVKHFRWERTEASARRLHKKPSAAHITACRPWLESEIDAVRPTGMVALGAVAAQSLFGPSFRLTQHRGATLGWPPDSGPFAEDRNHVRFVVATVHPSAVLRARSADRDEMYAGLVADLRLAARTVDRSSSNTS